MILKPIDETFILPAAETPSDIFAYLATYNGFAFYETDLNGVVPNEIENNYFLVDRIDLASPQTNRTGQEIKYDGSLFIGLPASPNTDVNVSSFEDGQFLNIVADLLTKDFINQMLKYVRCDFALDINSLRPLYNSNKYTKATNATGVEISYSIWI